MPGTKAPSSAAYSTSAPRADQQRAGQQDATMMQAAAFNNVGPPAMLQPCLWVRPQPAPVGKRCLRQLPPCRAALQPPCRITCCFPF